MSARVRLIPPARFAEAEPLWRALEAELPLVPVARGWAWASAWVAAYGDLLPTSVAVVSGPDGSVWGIALLPRGRRRFGPVTIRSLWIGTANLPVGSEVCAEFTGPLARPGREREVVAAIVAAARRWRGWDELRAEGLAAEDAERLRATWPAGRVRVREEPSPFCDLGALAPEEDVAAALGSGSARRRARTSLRAMAQRGVVESEWATDPARAAELLEELITLHQARWTADGEPGVFAAPRFAAFHRELAPRLVAEGRATLFRATVDGRTIGCLYHFLDGERVLFYQSGLAGFDDNRLRPGIVTHLLSMEAARERGLRLYDFLAGDQRYKRDLSSDAATISGLTLRRRRLRLALYDGARRARDRRAG
ncbi:GNAT family N-acetyltransferase [Patulibacter defluvii]|uniref:GNAT family N-acetyltransferase n=1 Tax=Patulibacter defluvii TaxID=3095358 RepID=UPI002A752F58|nr:GNAT family N-acetyltransferase [Patulibacter sp. DM4]